MGTRVYLFGRYFDGDTDDLIDVLGLDRHRRYRVVTVPKEYIENVRCSKVYKHAVLRIMNNWEYSRFWWSDSQEDGKEVKEFARRWNENDYLGYTYDLMALRWFLRSGCSEGSIRVKLSDDVILRSVIDNARIEGIDEVVDYLESFHHELNDPDIGPTIDSGDVRFADGAVKECVLIFSKKYENGLCIDIFLNDEQRIKLIRISYLDK